MKHFLLKFNHGVEIGARLAYEGHFKRTKELGINAIILDEILHRQTLETMLKAEGEVPNKFIDFTFTVIGTVVSRLCQVSPLWSLDLIARFMEAFAVFSYVQVSKKYPQYKDTLGYMAFVEEEHKRYFSKRRSS